MTEKRSNAKAFYDNSRGQLFILGGQDKSSESCAEVLEMNLDKPDISANALTNSFTMVSIDFIQDLTFKKYVLL